MQIDNLINPFHELMAPLNRTFPSLNRKRKIDVVLFKAACHFDNVLYLIVAILFGGMYSNINDVYQLNIIVNYVLDFMALTFILIICMMLFSLVYFFYLTRQKSKAFKEFDQIKELKEKSAIALRDIHFQYKSRTTTNDFKSDYYDGVFSNKAKEYALMLLSDDKSDRLRAFEFVFLDDFFSFEYHIKELNNEMSKKLEENDRCKKEQLLQAL